MSSREVEKREVGESGLLMLGGEELGMKRSGSKC